MLPEAFGKPLRLKRQKVDDKFTSAKFPKMFVLAVSRAPDKRGYLGKFKDTRSVRYVLLIVL